MSYCALYRHFDELGTLLYVGISGDPHTRTASHVAGAEWVQFARRGSVEWHPSTGAAAVAEAFAIRTEGPIFNRAYTAGVPDARIAAYLTRRGERSRARLTTGVNLEDLTTLADAVDVLHLGERGLKRLRNARDRDSRFPRPVDVGTRGVQIYRLSELAAWIGAGGEAL